MTFDRLIHTLAMYSKLGSNARAKYLREKKVFGLIGKNVCYQGRVIPLYPELIKLHDNVTIAHNVHFETHDMINRMINLARPGTKLPEYIGCIEIMENVFVGSDTTILYGVKIGANCIIGSGSLVTKDCEPNSIYAGVPAKRIGSFDDFVQKRLKLDYAYVSKNQSITAEEIADAWRRFDEKHT